LIGTNTELKYLNHRITTLDDTTIQN